MIDWRTQSHSVSGDGNHFLPSCLLFNPLPVLHPFINLFTQPSVPQENHSSLYYLYLSFIFIILPSYHQFQYPSAPLFMHPFPHWLNVSARRCQVPLAETSRCILWSSIFFYWCRKHPGLQAESHTWHHPPWRLSKLSTRQKSLYIAGVVDISLTISIHIHIICLLNQGEAGTRRLLGYIKQLWGNQKYTHKGSNNDLPPESISNKQKSTWTVRENSLWVNFLLLSVASHHQLITTGLSS